MTRIPIIDASIQQILVWDFPTRVFHWSLAVCFAVAYLTAEADGFALVHQIAGYLFAALIAFRWVWGLVGSRYARFTEFLRTPATALNYLGAYVKGKAGHYVGHNPLGALAIMLMLLLGTGIGVTGWLSVSEAGGEAYEEVHELFANAMLVVVVLHIIGVIATSLMYRANLTRTMVTGYKQGASDAGIKSGHHVIALLLIAALGVFGWLLFQGKLPALLDPAAVISEHGSDADHEDHVKDGNKRSED